MLASQFREICVLVWPWEGTGGAPCTMTAMDGKTLLWKPAGLAPQLGGGEVHVWAWNLPHDTDRAQWEMLDEDETLRARRFLFARDRHRYVRAHSTVRRILGAYSGRSPKQVNFVAGRYGKPQISTPDSAPALHFNLSHSGDVALLAVSRAYELGIDVEIIRPIEEDVARSNFSPPELNGLRGLAPHDWLAGFYRCWTSKEALLKGEGLGLNIPLDSFDVEADPQKPAALLSWRAAANFAARWRLIELVPAPGTAGALAVQSGDLPTVQCFTVPE